MAKEMLGAKIASRTMERLEKYAEREGVSKSEAADRILKQGLDVEESDMRLVPVRSDGGTIIEDRLDEIEKKQRRRFDEIENRVDKDETLADRALELSIIVFAQIAIIAGVADILLSYDLVGFAVISLVLSLALIAVNSIYKSYRR